MSGGRGGARRRVLICVAAFGAALALVPSAFADAFQVNSAADTLDATPDCSLAPSGPCTLRDALTLAAGTGTANTIGFNVGTGPITISPATPLPAVPANTTINGTTQPGYGPADKPIVILDGSAQQTGFGLDLAGAGDKLVALELIDFRQNTGAALHLSGSGATLENNYIGTDATGTPGLGNSIGILVNRETNTIGAGSPGTGNVISGNTGDGIEVINPNPAFNPNMGGELVEGNLIGVAPDGTTPLGNGGNGVYVLMDGIDNDSIGTTAAGAGNTIAYNGKNGVFVDGTLGRGLTVRGNSIHDNGQLGIDMAPAGVDPSPKPTGGADESVSAPILTSAVTTGGLTTVSGAVPASGNSIYAFDIYASGTCDPSGHGEGAHYLGTITPSGPPFNGFSGTVAAAGPTETWITAVAVDQSLVATSEFSTCLALGTSRYVVTSTADTAGSTCDASTPCTLRQAITAANATAVSSEIDFDIPGTGVQTIQPSSQLPAITAPTRIDGTTQPGFTSCATGPMLIELNGSASGGADGLLITGGSSTVRGLAIDRFANPGSGIHLQGGTGNRIACNYIGTNPAGSAPAGNWVGVIADSAGNTIGATPVGAGNVISGNGESGIRLQAPNNVVEGNYIGTDATGQHGLGAGLGPSATGIFVNGSSNEQIGGVGGQKTRNVISGNGAYGIALNGTGTLVGSNYIGVGADGTTAVPNTQSGILLGDSTTGNTIGGTGSGGRNVISGNGGYGIFVNGAGGASLGNVIEGNYIGVDATGGAALANANGGIDLVQASNGSRNEQIGGTVAGAGNVIEHNGGPGVTITGAGSIGNSIQQNSIDANTGLGIDLGGDGVTPNDPQPDADTGPNGLQNFPDSLAAQLSGSTVHITGSFGSAPASNYTIEFFASDTADPSGNGEGARWLGSTGVTTDGNGHVPLDVMLTPESPVAAGQWLTATATAPDGSTSEFSQAVQITNGGGTTITIAPEADTYVAAGAPSTNFSTLDYSDVYGGKNPSCVLANGTSYTLMRFDLSAIPAGMTITNVELDTTTRAGYAQDGDPAHWAIFVPDDSWNPATVTWNTRPSDGIPTVGSPDLGGGVDVRTSPISLGAADTFRAGCSTDPDTSNTGGDQAKTFPSTDDGFPRTVAQAEAAFKTRVATERAGDGKLSIELWTPDCATGCLGPDQAYWARYYTTRAANPAVRPKLVVTVSGPTGSVGLTASAPNVVAGAAQVKLKDVPPSAIVGSALGVSSAPVGSIPVGSIPVGSIPVGSIPVGSIPVGSIGFTASQTLLSSVALSTIPLLPPSSWSAVLAGTPLATLPLQNVTLGQVLANATAAGRLSSVPVGSIDLSRSPLGSIPVGSIPLGSIPVGSIPVPPASGEPSSDSTLQRWCTWLAGPPINCTDPTSLAGAGTTLMSLALQGAPVGSIPIGSIPVGSIPVGSIPLGSIPLGSIPVGSITIDRVSISFSPIGSIPVGSIPVGSIPVGSIPIGSIPVGSIDLQNSPVGSIPVGSISPSLCRATCPTTGLLRDHLADFVAGLTLEQLLRGTTPGTFDHITFADVIGFTAPSVLHGFTIAQLIASLPPNANVTYADLLALLLDPNALGWESLNLHATKVQNLSTNGSTVDYTASFHLDSNGGPSGVAHPTTLNVTMPDGFLYQPGSTKLEVDNGSGFVLDASQPGDPTLSSDGSTLTWTLSPLTDKDYEIVFTTRPSLTLGPTAATAKLTPAGSGTAASETPADVGVGDTFEPNNTPATAQPITSDSFYLSYITSKSDVDYYTFPVPPAGTRTTFHLSHLPADYDLVVYGPAGAQQLRPPVASMPPIDGQPLADNGFATTHATDPLAPQTLNDVALAPGLPVYGVSTLRGTQDDAVAVISNGEPGVYTVQVSGFDGASSDQPYMLRAETTPPPAAPSCVPRTLTGNASAATSLVTVASGQAPSAVNTLFVVDDQQLANVYGAAGTGVVTKLTSAATLNGLAAAGFPAAVVHVDNDATVQRAFSAWNGCPADPGKANDVVRAIGAVLDSVQQTYPNAEYRVLVGGDDVLPFARIDDLTTVSTENGYAATFPASTALGGSLADAKILTDDPYGTTAPVPFLNRQLYVPDLVTGRLVETPANINAQIDAFLGGPTPGHLHPATALTTGYNFLSDGATAVSGALGTVATAAGSNKTAISDTWTKSTLVGPGGLLLPSSGAPPPDIVSLNAHADHNRFEPAAGADLLNASEVASATQTFGGRLVLSMGCHAGLSVFDAFVAQNNLDWAQLFAQKGAADYVANSGYGYGDSTSIAYSEELNRLFAGKAVTGAASAAGANMTLGEALTTAKQTYKGDLGIVGVYDEKAMAELTLYGLPMYRIGGSGAVAPQPPPAAPPVSSFPTDPSTGLHVESFAANAAFDPSSPTVTSRGSFYSGADGVELEHFRPIQPKAIRALTIPQAHGALLTELTSQDVPNFDPVYARPTVDSSTTEPEVTFDDVAFPSKLQAVTTFKQLQSTQQQVVLAQGQFFAGNPADGSGLGTERLFTHEAGQVFSSTSTNFAPPAFSTLSADIVSGNASFSVDVTDPAGAVKRVVVAYQDTPNTPWRFVDLVQSAPGSSRWTGSGPVSTDHLQFFAQAVDEFGNVGVSTNKGLYYRETPPPPPPSGGVAVVASAGSPPQLGWFIGTATLTVTVNGQAPAPGTATLAIDGGAPQPYTAPVPVAGDGPHTATAQTADGSATTSFFIDTLPPVVDLATPTDGGAVAQGSPATPSFTCADAGIGVQSCTSSAFDTASLGFHTFTVNASDKLGNQATASAIYAVIAITAPAADASLVRGTVVNASFACGTPTCTALVTKPGGATVAVANGAPLPTDVEGTYSLAVTAADAAGHHATLTQRYTVTPVASLNGKLVFTRANHIWAINPDGTGLVQLTFGAGLDDQASISPDGTRLVFARRSTATGPSQLWLTDADGRNPVQLTNTGDNTAPAWSPDGTKIAFSSNRTGSTGYDIWTLNPNTGVLANLTSSAGDDVTPSWSPTSVGKIVFASNIKKGQFEIFTMTTTGGSVTQLTNDPATDVQPSWSPDGTKIAFSSNRATSGTPNGFEIYAMSAPNGASQNRLTTLAGDDRAPTWVGNTSLVFASSGLHGLATIAATGGTPTKIPNTIDGDANPD